MRRFFLPLAVLFFAAPLGADTARSAVDGQGRLLIARWLADQKKIEAVLWDSDGELLSEAPVEVVTGAAAGPLENVTALTNHQWMVLWREPSAATTVWKAQTIDLSGQRGFPGDGATLYEAPSEADAVALGVRSSGETALAFSEAGASAARMHLLIWAPGRLGGPPREMESAAPLGASVVALSPVKASRWTLVYALPAPSGALGALSFSAGRQ